MSPVQGLAPHGFVRAANGSELTDVSLLLALTFSLCISMNSALRGLSLGVPSCELGIGERYPAQSWKGQQRWPMTVLEAGSNTRWASERWQCIHNAARYTGVCRWCHSWQLSTIDSYKLQVEVLVWLVCVWGWDLQLSLDLQGKQAWSKAVGTSWTECGESPYWDGGISTLGETLVSSSLTSIECGNGITIWLLVAGKPVTLRLAHSWTALSAGLLSHHTAAPSPFHLHTRHCHNYFLLPKLRSFLGELSSSKASYLFPL